MDQANRQSIKQARRQISLLTSYGEGCQDSSQLYYTIIITRNLHCTFIFIIHDDTILDYSHMHRGLRVLKLVTTAILRNQIFMTMYITTVTTI